MLYSKSENLENCLQSWPLFIRRNETMTQKVGKKSSGEIIIFLVVIAWRKWSRFFWFLPMLLPQTGNAIKKETKTLLHKDELQKSSQKADI